MVGNVKFHGSFAGGYVSKGEGATVPQVNKTNKGTQSSPNPPVSTTDFNSTKTGTSGGKIAPVTSIGKIPQKDITITQVKDTSGYYSYKQGAFITNSGKVFSTANPDFVPEGLTKTATPITEQYSKGQLQKLINISGNAGKVNVNEIQNNAGAIEQLSNKALGKYSGDQVNYLLNATGQPQDKETIEAIKKNPNALQQLEKKAYGIPQETFIPSSILSNPVKAQQYAQEYQQNLEVIPRQLELSGGRVMQKDLLANKELNLYMGQIAIKDYSIGTSDSKVSKPVTLATINTGIGYDLPPIVTTTTKTIVVNPIDSSKIFSTPNWYEKIYDKSLGRSLQFFADVFAEGSYQEYKAKNLMSDLNNNITKQLKQSNSTLSKLGLTELSGLTRVQKNFFGVGEGIGKVGQWYFEEKKEQLRKPSELGTTVLLGGLYGFGMGSLETLGTTYKGLKFIKPITKMVNYALLGAYVGGTGYQVYQAKGTEAKAKILLGQDLPLLLFGAGYKGGREMFTGVGRAELRLSRIQKQIETKGLPEMQINIGLEQGKESASIYGKKIKLTPVSETESKIMNRVEIVNRIKYVPTMKGGKNIIEERSTIDVKSFSNRFKDTGKYNKIPQGDILSSRYDIEGKYIPRYSIMTGKRGANTFMFSSDFKTGKGYSLIESKTYNKEFLINQELAGTETKTTILTKSYLKKLLGFKNQYIKVFEGTTKSPVVNPSILFTEAQKELTLKGLKYQVPYRTITAETDLYLQKAVGGAEGKLQPEGYLLTAQSNVLEAKSTRPKIKVNLARGEEGTYKTPAGDIEYTIPSKLKLEESKIIYEFADYVQKPKNLYFRQIGNEIDLSLPARTQVNEKINLYPVGRVRFVPKTNSIIEQAPIKTSRVSQYIERARIQDQERLLNQFINDKNILKKYPFSKLVEEIGKGKKAKENILSAKDEAVRSKLVSGSQARYNKMVKELNKPTIYPTAEETAKANLQAKNLINKNQIYQRFLENTYGVKPKEQLKQEYKPLSAKDEAVRLKLVSESQARYNKMVNELSNKPTIYPTAEETAKANKQAQLIKDTNRIYQRFLEITYGVKPKEQPVKPRSAEEINKAMAEADKFQKLTRYYNEKAIKGEEALKELMGTKESQPKKSYKGSTQNLNVQKLKEYFANEQGTVVEETSPETTQTIKLQKFNVAKALKNLEIPYSEFGNIGLKTKQFYTNIPSLKGLNKIVKPLSITTISTQYQQERTKTLPTYKLNLTSIEQNKLIQRQNEVLKNLLKNNEISVSKTNQVQREVQKQNEIQVSTQVQQQREVQIQTQVSRQIQREIQIQTNVTRTPRMIIPIIPPPYIPEMADLLHGGYMPKRSKKGKKKYKYNRAYVPDFSSKQLNISIKGDKNIIKRILKGTFTGLETRPQIKMYG